MLKLRLTAVPVLLANKKLGGATAKLAPAFAPEGARRVALQSSRPPVWKIQITSVLDVVVIENA